MRRSKYSDEDFASAVADSSNWAQVARSVGLVHNGPSYKQMKADAARLGLSTDHFGGTWSTKSLPLQEILVKGRPVDGRILKRRLLAAELLEKKCYNEECGITEWFGEDIFDIEHINGDHSDNRIENITLLCPNCHRLTPTWGYKKR